MKKYRVRFGSNDRNGCGVFDEVREVLVEIMDARGLMQKDLTEVFGSKGRTSEAIRGKREISKTQAKALAEFFDVSVELFI